jgi:hypothetical protein
MDFDDYPASVSQEERVILHQIEKLQHRIDKKKSLVWMPKAIGVASCHPYYEFFEKILHDLHQRFHPQNKSQFQHSESLLE